MSEADRSWYAESVTKLSEGELRDVLAAAEPPVCLLGGWAVHLHVTDGFHSAHGRAYIGSRDIDLGVHVDPEWSEDDLADSAVGRTLETIEADLGYQRGRFGFYREFHRETGARLDAEAVRREPPHNVFRLDIDVMPDTPDLDAFEAAFGFRPPAEPLLEPVFEDDEGTALSAFVDWDVQPETVVVPAALLGAMKVRAIPQRDESHKLVKDLADLHALLWYVTDYDEMRMAIMDYLTEEDIHRFTAVANEDGYERAAGIIEVDSDLVRPSVEGLVT